MENAPSARNQKCAPGDKERVLFIEKVLALVPDWFIFMQMRNPNYTVLTGHLHTL